LGKRRSAGIQEGGDTQQQHDKQAHGYRFFSTHVCIPFENLHPIRMKQLVKSRIAGPRSGGQRKNEIVKSYNEILYSYWHMREVLQIFTQHQSDDNDENPLCDPEDYQTYDTYDF